MDRIGNLLVARTPLKKRTIKKGQLSLLPPDFSLLKTEHCPKCTAKLYWMRLNQGIRCKKKGCGFGLSLGAFNDIVSGKRLNDYKEQRRIDLR